MKRQSQTLLMFADHTALNSSAQDGPVKATRWLEGVVEWLTSEADCGVKSSGFLPNSVPVGFLEKTSLEFCQSTEGGIGLPSSGTWRNSGMGPPTVFSTLNTSECHKGADVCSLSDILETGDVRQKYYLSPKACRGILRRAEARGRELPEALRRALTAVATTEDSEPNREST